MSQDLKVELSAELMEQLNIYAALLHKEKNTMLEEALKQYFLDADKSLSEKDPDTNISFDEFWADVDL